MVLLKRAFLLAAAVFLSTATAQLLDYSTLQTTLNAAATKAEKELQSTRLAISEYVLATTDDMITYATNSLSEDGNDPKAPMIGACTLYPTNFLNHFTKEVNVKVAETQAQLNSLKFAVLKSLVNQPMISEGEATFAKVQTQVQALADAWPATKAALDAEIAAYKVKVNQLVVEMKECIRIAEE